METPRPLTATSFAILGLLSFRSWSTYELAKQVQRSLKHFWPRAESNIYAEPKRLVADGYAVEQREETGRRARTVYSITARGREVLRAWLAEPGTSVRLESEAFLKVFYADQGSKADLLATIKAVGQAAEAERSELSQVVQEYLNGNGPFPERVAVTSLTVDFIGEHLQAIITWSKRAAELVEGWNSSAGTERPIWPQAVMQGPPGADWAQRIRGVGAAPASVQTISQRSPPPRTREGG